MCPDLHECGIGKGKCTEIKHLYTFLLQFNVLGQIQYIYIYIYIYIFFIYISYRPTINTKLVPGHVRTYSRFEGHFNYL